MLSFIRLNYKYIGIKYKPKTEGLILKTILKNASLPTNWFVNLDTQRNYFMHNGSPYIAIDASNAPNSYELLIMKENIKDFQNKEKYLTLSDLSDIVNNFNKAKMVLAKHLIEKYNIL